MGKVTKGLVLASLEEADNERAKLSERERELFGLSSIRLRCFLNNIASKEYTNFLEIGTYRGATAISAAYGNPKTKVVTVDDFSYDDREPKKFAPEGSIWENVKSQLEDNLSRYRDPDSGVDVNKIEVIQESFDKVSWEGMPKFDVCFFDVNPIKEDTYKKFFETVMPQMIKESVVVFTNYSNELHARQLKEALAEYSDTYSTEWEEYRISDGLSDATKYYSGILIVGLKKLKND